MAAGDSNPSFEGSWTDDSGIVWRRKGKRGRVLDDRRVRSLLHRDGVPLVVWESFETREYEAAEAKKAAASRLGVGTSSPDDVHASEWLAPDGRLLLMLEHLC